MTLYIEHAVEHTALTQQILQRNPHQPVIRVETYKTIIPSTIQDTDWVLVHYRGRFLEKCPGTSHHICCNYYIIHWAM